MEEAFFALTADGVDADLANPVVADPTDFGELLLRRSEQMEGVRLKDFSMDFSAWSRSFKSHN